MRYTAYAAKARNGRLAQLVRAPALQAGGRRFEPCTAHHPKCVSRVVVNRARLLQSSFGQGQLARIVDLLSAGVESWLEYPAEFNSYNETASRTLPGALKWGRSSVG